jgi:hypothetical protein
MVNKLLLAALVAAVAAAPAGAAKWRRIFDGRTLNGWTPKITGHRLGDNWRNTFRVKDGALRVSYDGYPAFDGRFGHIAWKRPVAAPFRIRFEYRFSGTYLPDVEGWQHSNSGLMFLAQAPETMTLDQKFPVSMELQLLGADGPAPRSTGNLCTPGTHVVMAGQLITEHCTNSASATYPNERWIKVEVDVARDGRITHYIEGKPVLHYSGAQLDPTDEDAKPLIARAGGRLPVTSGWLYLQSEGHPVEFRKIELKELR